jgi:hypothetical protein
MQEYKPKKLAKPRKKRGPDMTTEPSMGNLARAAKPSMGKKRSVLRKDHAKPTKLS